MSARTFSVKLYLPSQAAVETEATIVKWHVAEGDSFEKGEVLAGAESAKAAFDFEAPCRGTVKKLLFAEGDVALFDQPVVEITTDDLSMKHDSRPADAGGSGIAEMNVLPVPDTPLGAETEISILGIGSYVPARVVENSELLRDFPDITEEYLFGVTGIRKRHWAQKGEKPSDMAFKATTVALEKSNISAGDIGAIVVATTTPDVVMPSTACILQERLGAWGVPAFDINAACSGWLYGLTIAKTMLLGGMLDNVLVVGVDVQSSLLDKKDKDTYFLFGDGAGAAIVSRGARRHVIKKEILIADARGARMARREYPGYLVHADEKEFDPYVRLDGHALFRFATGSFSSVISDVILKSGWEPSDVRWIVPHQANGRILKAVARKSGIPFERIYLNIDHVGNTSSASIPLALTEIENGLQQGDKIILCSVGAGITAAALSVEW